MQDQPDQDAMCECGHTYAEHFGPEEAEHFGEEETECLHYEGGRFCRCDAFMRPGPVLEQI